MVVSCYKLRYLMCLILLLSFQLAISAETTAAPLSCKTFQSNQFLEFPLFPWMPLQTHEPSTGAQGGEAPDAPIPALPPRDSYDGLDLQRKSGVDQGGAAPRSPPQVGCSALATPVAAPAAPPGSEGAALRSPPTDGSAACEASADEPTAFPEQGVAAPRSSSMASSAAAPAAPPGSEVAAIRSPPVDGSSECATSMDERAA